MQNVSLNADVRALGSKGYLKDLRDQGGIPAVLYGKEAGNQLLQVDSKDFRDLLVNGGKNSLVDLSVKGKSYKVLIKKIDMEPIKREVRHIDFHQVSLKDKIHTKVAIHLIGEAQGVLNGGTLQYGAREVEVECLPTDMPEAVEVDITNLQIGESVSVKDIAPIDKVAILSDGDTLIANIIQPRLAEEEDVAAEGENKEVSIEEKEGQIETKETEVE